MMHFEMVSKTVARQEHAQVNQCFLCHRTRIRSTTSKGLVGSSITDNRGGIWPDDLKLGCSIEKILLPNKQALQRH